MGAVMDTPLDDVGFSSEVELGTCIGMTRAEAEATLIALDTERVGLTLERCLEVGTLHECSKHPGRYLNGPPFSGINGRWTKKTWEWWDARQATLDNR